MGRPEWEARVEQLSHAFQDRSDEPHQGPSLIRLTKHFGREVVKGIYDYCRDRCLWAFRYEEDRADTLKRMEFAIRCW